MKKFQKLNEKKIASLETVKGGLMALQPEFSMEDSGESTGTTTHTPSQVGDQFFCDHKTDTKK
ncbi:hypothetical protein CLV59_101771 [Chitinophaga dinghuensis]|uniref:Uncharacterized protein n=1 Tax=Chitinophaga dinghuensis TaxID=1539050 RepID=A0A327WF21_9BACT|nr:hypothetical protein [Chitinophaga dinghuensis]RAJ88006.1 hypothetical protein CLV59_101771 [Chitinophaga dinghuensis]